MNDDLGWAVIIAMSISFVFGLIAGQRVDVEWDQIEAAQIACEANDGLAGVDQAKATCKNGAEFRITERWPTTTGVTMDDNDVKIFRTAIWGAVAFVALMVSSCQTTNYHIRKSIQAGASPIAARCALSGETNQGQCAILAAAETRD